MEIKKVHQASCHCKAVQFDVHLSNGLVNPRRCDCSFCCMLGSIVASATLDEIKILKGEDKLSLYQFNTMTAQHYFCSICGIYTHHRRRSNPNQFGFNVACLEGINPYELGPVPIMDGINHPADRKP